MYPSRHLRAILQGGQGDSIIGRITIVCSDYEDSRIDELYLLPISDRLRDSVKERRDMAVQAGASVQVGGKIKFPVIPA